MRGRQLHSLPGWGVEPPTKLSKKGVLTGPQFLEGCDLFQRVAVFT